ncbi:putative zinc-binding metallopeptidase [Cupriavidus sp. WKF15]|uniref:zinc-binding metallopeptidase family protein n=1 Tax=Cupriavidus sp. WKF15 TaxID=3032282 RepID=UPI0023E2E40C|nr:putative zinc-binding metallopeptidase [Cupriavidus sp. WKF15]WER46674.1 putative zinc-binding metallopeptidase [Cupriavidus sp. WKF15]
MTDLPLPSAKAAHGVAIPRAYQCICGQQVFFRNSRCLACEAPLGYAPSLRGLYPLEAGPEPDTWRIVGNDAASALLYRRCANFTTAASCNWLIEPDDAAHPDLCKACRLNRTIPDLSCSENLPLWQNLERAKRRLVSQLIGLGLPVKSKVVEDPDRGLAYDFLRRLPGQPRVLTGHVRGIITIDLEEADDVFRERARVAMHEPYRTLLGHFRHEVGHYYWWRLIMGSDWQDAGRRVFGDDRQDYAAALKQGYRHGPPADWAQHFVSAYASVHPFEDWAESWAHYLHLRDTLDTAISFGIAPMQVDSESESFGVPDLWWTDDPGGDAFLEMLHRWIQITGVMNEMSRAMGQHDFYPFVLPRRAVAKLHFIHCAVSRLPELPQCKCPV